MRLSTFIMGLLMIGGIFFIMAFMVNEGSQKYDISINNSSWAGQYDYSEGINEDTQNIKNSLEDLANEDKGFLEKVGAGFTGIVTAITLLPTMLAGTLFSGENLITGLLTSLNIPTTLILIIISMFVFWAIIKLLEVYQRWQI